MLANRCFARSHKALANIRRKLPVSLESGSPKNDFGPELTGRAYRKMKIVIPSCGSIGASSVDATP
jgi:hypothetical protein